MSKRASYPEGGPQKERRGNNMMIWILFAIIFLVFLLMLSILNLGDMLNF